MFSEEVTIALVKATLTYGAPAVIDIITHWGDAEPTVEELETRLANYPKAEDAFK